MIFQGGIETHQVRMGGFPRIFSDQIWEVILTFHARSPSGDTWSDFSADDGLDCGIYPLVI